MCTTLLRHWTMLRMIPRHPRKSTVSELKNGLSAQGYEITECTGQRGLVALSGKGFALAVDVRK